MSLSNLRKFKVSINLFGAMILLKYKVFVINLARSPQRLEAISAQLQKFGINFERIEAVDGNTYSAEQIEAVSPQALVNKSYYRDLGKGEVGCSLSHKRAWQKVIDDELDFAFILEDDITLEANFGDVIKLFESLPHNDWEYVKLYPMKRGSGKNIRHSFPYKGHEFVTYHKLPLSTAAQVVSYKGAQRLLKNMPYVLEPIDGQLKSWWTLDIYPMGLTPYCVSVAADVGSEINPNGGLERMKQRKLTKLLLNWTRAFKRMIAMPSLDKHFNQFKNSLK